LKGKGITLEGSKHEKKPFVRRGGLVGNSGVEEPKRGHRKKQIRSPTGLHISGRWVAQ